MGITVLIVDDSKLARIVAGKTITALQPGWTKLEAGSADEALAVIDREAVDVALLDFNMPGRDGLALASELRERRPTLPIAIVTANVQDEMSGRPGAIGAAFVAKTVTEDGLRGFLSGAALRLRAVQT